MTDQSAPAVGTAVIVVSSMVAFLSSGPHVTTEVFMAASMGGGIAGGIFSSMIDTNPLKLRTLIAVAGLGGMIGPVLVSLVLHQLSLPPTMQALGMVSGIVGATSWHIVKQIPSIVKWGIKTAQTVFTSNLTKRGE